MLEPIKTVIVDVNIEPVPRPCNRRRYPHILDFEAPVTDDPALDIYKKKVKQEHEFHRRIRRRH